MLNILSVFLATLSSAFRTHAALQVEILALRHQLLARTLKQQFPESETPVIAGPQF
ncbi:MAG TPA: hypothetical protein VF333_06435 [Pyrinomonadaceae bacterium]